VVCVFEDEPVQSSLIVLHLGQKSWRRRLCAAIHHRHTRQQLDEASHEQQEKNKEEEILKWQTVLLLEHSDYRRLLTAFQCNFEDLLFHSHELKLNLSSR
jgi:hypothetical protein